MLASGSSPQKPSPVPRSRTSNADALPTLPIASNEYLEPPIRQKPPRLPVRQGQKPRQGCRYRVPIEKNLCRREILVGEIVLQSCIWGELWTKLSERASGSAPVSRSVPGKGSGRPLTLITQGAGARRSFQEVLGRFRAARSSPTTTCESCFSPPCVLNQADLLNGTPSEHELGGPRNNQKRDHQKPHHNSFLQLTLEASRVKGLSGFQVQWPIGKRSRLTSGSDKSVLVTASTGDISISPSLSPSLSTHEWT